MSETENTQTINKNKRKRKKSFLKNARKYGKRGYYGRGTQLDADTYQYFVRILEVYREGFENEEDKLNFVNNVFEQTVDKELDCCCNQVGCRVLEMLLPFANNSTLQRYMDGFSEDLRPLCSDRFASHVLEALVTRACKISLKPSNQEEEEFVGKCQEFTLKISKFLLNNLEDYIWDVYGNHIIRTCLENLTQTPKELVDNKAKRAKVEAEEGNLPEDYVETVKSYGERLICWPQFNELCDSELSSGFLQVLMKCLKKVDSKLLKKYLKKLLEDVFKSNVAENEGRDSIPEVFLSKPKIMLLETSLALSKSKTFTKIYLQCFHNRLAKLAVIKNTSFAVQKLITNCKDKDEFERIFEELKSNFNEIIENNHTGIILALGQGCKNLSTKQGYFVQCLMQSVGCFEPEEKQQHFVKCLAKFTSYDNIQKQSNNNLENDKLNLHGTLLLQTILEFNKPIKVVNSLLNMETNELKRLFSNTMGSHIVDSYVTSVYVGEKSREKLIRKMKGTYQELASSKYGSRSFEALWGAANMKFKYLIIEELAYKDACWSNTEFGKIISSKVNLVLFKRNKEDWKQSMNVNASKVKEIFADILK